MKKIFPILFLVITLSSCDQQKSNSDAFGSFEAKEIMISSEASGKLLSFSIDEGDKLKANKKVGQIDTTIFELQLNELQARQEAVRTKFANTEKQIAVIKQQIENLDINIERVKNMLTQKAATQKQLDDLTGQKKVLLKQIEVHKSAKNSISKELNAIEKKKPLILEQKAKCQIINPVNGTVLSTYAEQFELTSPGKPLYKIADLNKMNLKVYVSANQLSELKLGQKCKVLIDQAENEFKTYEGKIIWISEQSEFTPKIIQTKEVRVNLVYAIKIEVKNDGYIKIGMPGEAIFKEKI